MSSCIITSLLSWRSAAAPLNSPVNWGRKRGLTDSEPASTRWLWRWTLFLLFVCSAELKASSRSVFRLTACCDATTLVASLQWFRCSVYLLKCVSLFCNISHGCLLSVLQPQCHSWLCSSHSWTCDHRRPRTQWIMGSSPPPPHSPPSPPGCRASCSQYERRKSQSALLTQPPSSFFSFSPSLRPNQRARRPSDIIADDKRRFDFCRAEEPCKYPPVRMEARSKWGWTGSEKCVQNGRKSDKTVLL